MYMNEEQTQKEEVIQTTEKTLFKKHFCTVTPFSKFLAMVLVISMPFLGFWVGLKYAVPDSSVDLSDAPTEVGATQRNVVPSQHLDASSTSPDSFIVGEEYVELGNGYVRDDEHVYFVLADGKRVIVPGADPDSFRIIDDLIAADIESVYYVEYDTVNKIEDAYPESFRTVQNENGTFAADEQSVFLFARYGFDRLPSADADSFEILQRCTEGRKAIPRFYRDKNRVFTNSGELSGIDVSSFEVMLHATSTELNWVTWAISRDKDTIYLGCGIPLKGIDADSFTHIGDGYGYDKDGIFFLDTSYSENFGLQDAVTVRIPATFDEFEMLGYGYAKISGKIFYRERILSEVDVDSFEVIDGFDSFYVKDEKHVFAYGEIVAEADPATFEVVDWGLAMDRSHVYNHLGELVEGVKPEDCFANQWGQYECSTWDRFE